MHSAVGSILRSSTRKIEDKINVLTFSTHERYQSNMADIDANFWLINSNKFKLWNTKFAEIPKNHICLNNIYSLNDLPNYIDFDLVLSQSKFNQYSFAKKISNQLNIPLITIEHTFMIEQRDILKNMIGDVNIFISEYSAKSWCANYPFYVIEHGINSKVFHNKNIKRDDVILSVVNDWINRDYECGFTLWKEITSNLPIRVVGNTPTLSEPAKDTDDLVNHYNKSLIFLNTSIYSPIPTTLLEAMSCGCCVVTTENEMISKVIQNGKNGFVSNDKNELRKYLEILLKNKNMAIEIGKNARDTILNNFSLKDFTENWNTVLRNSLRK